MLEILIFPVLIKKDVLHKWPEQLLAPLRLHMKSAFLFQTKHLRKWKNQMFTDSLILMCCGSTVFAQKDNLTIWKTGCNKTVCRNEKHQIKKLFQSGPSSNNLPTHAYVNTECHVSKPALYCRAVISGLCPCSSFIDVLTARTALLCYCPLNMVLGLTSCASRQGVSFVDVLNTIIYVLSQEHPLKMCLSFKSMLQRSTHFFSSLCACSSWCWSADNALVQCRQWSYAGL